LLADLAEQKREWKVGVLAYCLMTNHVHLLLAPESDGLSVSSLMKVLAGRHTRRFNRRYGRTGTLWEGRFHASLVETDRYLLACGAYIDLNPVRAGIAARPEDYRWSSYAVRAGLVRNTWLDPDPALGGLARSEEESRAAYRDYVDQGVPSRDMASIRRALKRNQLTGGKAFHTLVRHRAGITVPSRGPGRPPAGNSPRKPRSGH
jgi:putative transposase